MKGSWLIKKRYGKGYVQWLPKQVAQSEERLRHEPTGVVKQKNSEQKLGRENWEIFQDSAYEKAMLLKKPL